MQYPSLQALISASASSRKYFLSQPVSMQMELHKHNTDIHSAAALHAYVGVLENYNHAVEISEMLFKKS